MAKTMRALVLLAGLFCVSGKDTAKCALNGARAVDDLMDSAVFILASMYRCEHKQNIRCSLDISSAIGSVNAMINVILKAVDKCDGINTEHKDCGLAVGVLTRSFAGLAAASSGIVARCPNALNNNQQLGTVGNAMANAAAVNNVAGGQRAFKTAGLMGFGQCIVNVKSSFKSLFKAIKRIMTLKDNCDDPESKHCAHNAIKVVAAFTGMGEFLAGAIGNCVVDEKTRVSALCAQKAVMLLHHVQNVGRAGVNMAKHCEGSLSAFERKYLDEDDDDTVMQSPTAGLTTLAMAALLPIAAVFSFIGGVRFAKSRAQTAHDFESLMPVEEE